MLRLFCSGPNAPPVAACSIAWSGVCHRVGNFAISQPIEVMTVSRRRGSRCMPSATGRAAATFRLRKQPSPPPPPHLPPHVQPEQSSPAEAMSPQGRTLPVRAARSPTPAELRGPSDRLSAALCPTRRAQRVAECRSCLLRATVVPAAPELSQSRHRLSPPRRSRLRGAAESFTVG